jgi:hypothetical protein
MVPGAILDIRARLDSERDASNIHLARRLVWSPLRASSDHSFIVGALRAWRPCQLPRPSPSMLARFLSGMGSD